MRTLAAVVATLVPVLAAPLAAAEDDYSKHLEAKAASIVAVKFVAKIGQREHSVNDVGVVVDASGVVMLRNTAFRGFGDRKAVVSNLRVTVPGDEKEYEAIVGAMDSKLGLAFIRIRDLQGKTLAPVDVSSPPEVKLGDELFVVSRLDQGFDYAPYFGTARVAGQVTKPRAMWVITGFAPTAHVVFTPEGKAAGIVIVQTGVAEGGDSSSRIFLLPMKTAANTIQQAIKASETALAEDAARAKKDAEEKEKEAGAAPETPPTPAPPGTDPQK